MLPAALPRTIPDPEDFRVSPHISSVGLFLFKMRGIYTQRDSRFQGITDASLCGCSQRLQGGNSSKQFRCH